MDPGLKIAGVTKKAIEPFRNNGQGDDRDIQGQAKNDSKVAGVTNLKTHPHPNLSPQGRGKKFRNENILFSCLGSS